MDTIDSTGNYFVEVENIRITYVDKISRENEKDWSQSDTIRISAYKNINKDNSLHRGAEIPISSKEDIVNIISALCELYKLKT